MAEIRWFGHNCFRIRAKDNAIVTDPIGNRLGFHASKQTADIVTVSHPHPGHDNLDAVKLPFDTIAGPGEYEVNGVFITGVRTLHDPETGADGGFNTAYVMDVEGITICHLGDIGHLLTDEQLEALEGVDILMVPAGGYPLAAKTATEIVAQLEPKIVIPMQYPAGGGDAGRADVADFVKQLGIDAERMEKLAIKSSEIGEQTRLVVLELSS